MDKELSKPEIIYFEVNNWISGENYPAEEPFLDWMSYGESGLSVFASDEWVAENQLVVRAMPLDMSLNFCVTAPRKWVELNCPCLLERRNARFLYPPAPNGEAPCGKEDYFEDYAEPNIGKIIWHEEEE